MLYRKIFLSFILVLLALGLMGLSGCLGPNEQGGPQTGEILKLEIVSLTVSNTLDTTDIHTETKKYLVITTQINKEIADVFNVKASSETKTYRPYKLDARFQQLKIGDLVVIPILESEEKFMGGPVYAFPLRGIITTPKKAIKIIN